MSIRKRLCILISGVALLIWVAWANGATVTKYSFFDTFGVPDGPAPNWNPVSGEWKVENGKYSITAPPYVEAITLISSAKDLKDFIFEVKRIPPSTQYPVTSGLIFRKSGNNYYIWWIYWDPAPSYLLLLRKYINNICVESPIWIGIDEDMLGSPCTMKVIAEDNEFSCFIDEDEYTWIDYEPIETGTLGLIVSTAKESHMHFDNVKVTPLEK